MTPDQAADLAARTLAAIDRTAAYSAAPDKYHAASRERVASDLAGLRFCTTKTGRIRSQDAHLARLFAAGLRRTAALYGVTE